MIYKAQEGNAYLPLNNVHLNFIRIVIKNVRTFYYGSDLFYFDSDLVKSFALFSARKLA